MYKLGIFVDDDKYAVCVAFQELGEVQNRVEEIIYYQDYSFNKIIESVIELKKKYEVRNTLINDVDVILVEKFCKKGISINVKEVDEITSITAVKSLLRDKELSFANTELKDNIEDKLKNKFDELESKHILKSIYLVCSSKLEFSGMDLLMKMNKRRIRTY